MQVVSTYRPDTEWLTPERCYITELANSPGDESCSVALARVEPGVVTQLHCLVDVVERYVIIEGEGKVEVDGGDSVLVKRFDVVTISAGARQRITNVGRRDLLFLCVCTPRFKPVGYTSLE